MQLREAYKSVQSAGWRVVNVDTTIIAQQPKLAPHIPAMRANIAADLGLPEQAVNIKGKTNEKLGYFAVLGIWRLRTVRMWQKRRENREP